LPDGSNAAVTAGFLESGRTVSQASNVIAVIAGVGCWWLQGSIAILLFVSLIAWLAQTWFAARVAIDRSLFQTLAGDPEEGADKLDSLLAQWGVLKQARPRSIEDRSRGALRLLRLQSAALGLQVLALFCAMLLRTVEQH